MMGTELTLAVSPSSNLAHWVRKRVPGGPPHPDSNGKDDLNPNESVWLSPRSNVWYFIWILLPHNRRVFMSKSPTPNTLSVQIPVPNLSGQSLPNLTSASDSSPPTYSLHSLVVPKCLLSPTHRGISYPPPSPRNLRRSHALVQSRNPPLQKSKNILSPEKFASLDVQVPEFRGVTPPSNDTSPVTQPPPPPTPCSSNSVHSPEARRKEFFHDLSPSPGDDEVQIVHSNPDRELELGNPNSGIAKRLARNERADTKRYYTAGAIEDIKVSLLRFQTFDKVPTFFRTFSLQKTSKISCFKNCPFSKITKSFSKFLTLFKNIFFKISLFRYLTVFQDFHFFQNISLFPKFRLFPKLFNPFF